MAIPEATLHTWSHQGSVTASRQTHEAIRRALRRWDDLHDRNYEVYLQGSYKNSTNIRGSSDVDVVAQINDTFYSNKHRLPPDQRAAHERAYGSATYPLADFRRDVLQALRDHFGSNVIVEGNKAIAVRPDTGRLPADVIVCAQYRSYGYFRSLTDRGSIDGMTFWTKDGRQTINYPKPHYDNGVEKNSRCPSSYKASVRIFKHARDAVVDRNWIPATSVPSYFLECFAYNAADWCFSGSWQEVYMEVVNDLQTGDQEQFVSQNGIIPLFGMGYDQWDVNSAQTLVSALWRLWKEW